MTGSNCDSDKSPSTLMFLCPACATVFSCGPAAGVCAGTGIPGEKYNAANSLPSVAACGARWLLTTTMTERHANATTISLRTVNFIFPPNDQRTQYESRTFQNRNY